MFFVLSLIFSAHFCLRTKPDQPPCSNSSAKNISFITEINEFYNDIFVEIMSDESDPITIPSVANNYKIKGRGSNTVIRIPESFSVNGTLCLISLTAKIDFEKPCTKILRFPTVSITNVNFVIPENCKCKLFTNHIYTDFASTSGFDTVVSDDMMIYGDDPAGIPTKNSRLFFSDQMEIGKILFLCPPTDIIMTVKYSTIEIKYAKTGAKTTFYATSYSSFSLSNSHPINIVCTIDPLIDSTFKTDIKMELANCSLTFNGFKERKVVTDITMQNSVLKVGSGFVCKYLLLTSSQLIVTGDECKFGTVHSMAKNSSIDATASKCTITMDKMQYTNSLLLVKSANIQFITNEFVAYHVTQETSLCNWVVKDYIDISSSQIVFNNLVIYNPIRLTYCFNGRIPIKVLGVFECRSYLALEATYNQNISSEEKEEEFINKNNPFIVFNSTNNTYISNSSIYLVTSSSSPVNIPEGSSAVEKYASENEIGLILRHNISIVNPVVCVGIEKDCSSYSKYVDIESKNYSEHNKWTQWISEGTESLTFVFTAIYSHPFNLNLSLLQYSIPVTVNGAKGSEQNYITIRKDTNVVIPVLDLNDVVFEPLTKMTDIRFINATTSYLNFINFECENVERIDCQIEDVASIETENATIRVFFNESRELVILFDGNTLDVDNEFDQPMTYETTIEDISQNKYYFMIHERINCTLLADNINETIPSIYFEAVDPSVQVSATFIISESFNCYIGRPFVCTSTVTKATIECYCMKIPFHLMMFSEITLVAKFTNATDFMHFNHFVVRKNVSFNFQFDDPISFSDTIFNGTNAELVINEKTSDILLNDPVFNADNAAIKNVLVSGLMTVKKGDLSLTNADLSNSILMLSNPDDTLIEILPGIDLVLPPQQIIVSKFKSANKEILRFNKVTNMTEWMTKLVADDKKTEIVASITNSSIFISTKDKITSEQLRIILISVGGVILTIILVVGVIACFNSARQRNNEYTEELASQDVSINRNLIDEPIPVE